MLVEDARPLRSAEDRAKLQMSGELSPRVVPLKEWSPMLRWCALALLAAVSLHAQEAPIPMVDEISGRPFAIQKTWVIGGVGDWGYLTLDTAARQLFIAHGPTVQIVDIDSGTVLGTVGGFRDAHQVVLDQNGHSAYVADSSASQVKVIDRGTFDIVASIPTGPQPRSIVLEPSSGLLFAICGGPDQDESSPGRGRAAQRTPSAVRRTPPPPSQHAPTALSTITLIDTDKQEAMANVIVPGRLGFAQAGAEGQVYVTVQESKQIERFDAQVVRTVVHDEIATQIAHPQGPAKEKPEQLPQFDWSDLQRRAPDGLRLHVLSIGENCDDPRGLAIDSKRHRIFVACSNMKMAVVNGDTGSPLTSLTIGPGAEAIAYDPNRQLIFTANGGGYGSISIIRQHVTDSYAVIQNLPTLHQARTLAEDPSTGTVYLVTTLYGAQLANPPANGIGTLKLDPVNGSFQVIVVGN